MRTRVRWTLTDENGDVVPYASVRVYHADGKTIYRDPIYRMATEDSVFPNPFNVAPVRLEFFLDQQTRVVLGILTTPDGPELLTPAIEALPNADETAYSVTELNLLDHEGQGILRALSVDEGYWYRPGIGTHDHGGPGENALGLGTLSFSFSQLPGWPGATVLGGHDEQVDPDLFFSATWGDLGPDWGDLDGVPWGDLDQSNLSILGDPNGFDQTTAVGRASLAVGEGATTVGARAAGRPADDVTRATAIGAWSAADGESLAAGGSAFADEDATVLGPECFGATSSVTAGRYASGPADGVALGLLANQGDEALPGSILLGARARTLPRQTPTVVVGSAPGAAADFSDVDGAALLFQGLSQLLALGDLQVDGDVAAGDADSKIGFFGHAPTAPVFIGADEVGSGIEALDSLIYALRDLGLIRTRRDAVARYVPEGLAQTHRLGDEIREWPEANGAGQRLVTALGAEPHYRSPAGAQFEQSNTPWEFMLTEYAMTDSFRHVVVVASHATAPVRPDEGLAGVYAFVSGSVATSYPTQPLARTWTGWTTTTGGLSGFAVDGQAQSRSLALDTKPHVYMVTAAQEWPSRVWFSLGRSGYPGTPGWPGLVSEVALLDSSWTTQAASSYAAGLVFRHNIGQASDWLTVSALKFLRSQQGDSGVSILFNQDYASTASLRMVSGKVSAYGGVTSKNVPLIRIGNYSTVIAYSYEGAVAGYWSYLVNPQNYYVELYSFPNGFAGTWSASALVGRFALNASGTWSTGTKRIRRGVKRWRLVLRSTLAAVVTDEWVPGVYYDTAVKIYTEDDAGVRTLASTVPLQGDGTWFGTTQHTGRVVAELVRRSTNGLVATTAHHLPVDVLARSGDVDYVTASANGSIRVAALTAIAYLGAGQQYWALAGNILRDLQLLQEADGSLFAAYNVTATPVVPVTTDVLDRDLAWVGIAAALFGEVSGDLGRFDQLAFGIASYLVAQQDVDTGSIRDTGMPPFVQEDPENPEEPPPYLGDFSTETSAVTWLFFHTLDRVSGDDAWAYMTSAIGEALRTTHWSPALRRFVLKVGDTARDIRADIWGGLYQLITGDRAGAKLSLRSVAYAKRTGMTLTDSYFSGATGLAGYLPTNTSGAITLDQEVTWAALLLRALYGEPVGDDLTSMHRWTAATPNPYPQFLNYSSTGGGTLIVRPSAAVAAQALMMAQSGTLAWGRPISAPVVRASRLTVLKLASGGYQFTYEWVSGDERQPAAYEAVAERSFDDGTTWVAMPSRSRKGQISQVRRTTDSPWSWAYGATWTESGPLTNSTVTRVNIRMRAKEFGPWGMTEARYPNGQILPFVSPPLTEPEPDGEVPA